VEKEAETTDIRQTDITETLYKLPETLGVCIVFFGR